MRSDASAARPAGPHRGLALLRFGIGGLAAVLLAIAGRQMQGIESVAGDSIAEAFYHAVGVACYGVAALAVLLGLPRHRG